MKHGMISWLFRRCNKISPKCRRGAYIYIYKDRFVVKIVLETATSFGKLRIKEINFYVQ